jgi:hypothetical protein
MEKKELNPPVHVEVDSVGNMTVRLKNGQEIVLGADEKEIQAYLIYRILVLAGA